MLENIEKEISKITSWLQDYKERTGCRGVVVGISGGKDSTVVAMLAKKVWGDNVIGVTMPNQHRVDKDVLDIIQSIGIKYHVVNIAPFYNEIISSLRTRRETTFLPPPCDKKTKTNIPPRLRMTVLYAIAQEIGYRVIGTGNLSEKYIGWFTKWGDGACDLNPLAHLTCTEVVQLWDALAEEFGLGKEYIHKVPSDGLCGKTDEESFGFSYELLDKYIREGTSGIEEIDAIIREMHANTEHKRNMPATVE